MTQVSAAEMAAREAIATFLDRTKIGFVRAGFDADAALPCKRGAVTRHPRRQPTIKHIDTAGDELHQLRRRAESHRIARLGWRQKGLGQFNRTKHFRLRLADT